MTTPVRRALRLAAVGAATLAVAATTLGPVAQATRDGDQRAAYRAAAQGRGDLVRLDLLAINDFHGNLEEIPATSSAGRINNTPAGGAEFLATHLKRLRTKAHLAGGHTLTVAAGDLVGASPLLSAAFHDEPTIHALNRMRLDVAAVGNHEFDEGYRELLRLQRGGCLDDGPDGTDNQNSCPAGRTFPGARFQYLAANVVRDSTGRTILPATSVQRVDGIKVGFIGMTLEGTPSIVSQAGIRGLTFSDEARTANALVPRLRERGVQAIVVLLHEGGFTADPTAYDACPGISGPVVAINDRLHPEIDAVISGHTHQPYNCELQDRRGTPRLVTSASSFGRVVTDAHLLLDPLTGDVVRGAAYAQNTIVTRDIPKNAPAIARLIGTYQELVRDIAGEVIGHVTTTIERTADASGETPLGILIADSQRDFDGAFPAGQAPPADVAFMNPGGIRNDLVPEPDGDVTYGAAFSVQPFNNYVDSMTMTGRQLLTVLEQQFSGGNAAEPRILQVSGLTYTWDRSETGADKVLAGTVEVGGQPLVAGADYTVVANSFISDGGDNFPVFTQATDKYRGGLDIDALAEYLADNGTAGSPYAPQPTTRIDVQP